MKQEKGCNMGQYYRLVNIDRKEYIDPWEIGGIAKLWEWCVNPQCGVIPFLLRKSTETGGGDIRKEYEFAGKWAGDRIVLVGDYDESRLFDIVEKEYTNISLKIVSEYNDFIEAEDLKIRKAKGLDISPDSMTTSDS